MGQKPGDFLMNREHALNVAWSVFPIHGQLIRCGACILFKERAALPQYNDENDNPLRHQAIRTEFDVAR
jgi:hypothetical protein